MSHKFPGAARRDFLVLRGVLFRSWAPGRVPGFFWNPVGRGLISNFSDMKCVVLFRDFLYFRRRICIYSILANRLDIPRNLHEHLISRKHQAELANSTSFHSNFPIWSGEHPHDTTPFVYEMHTRERACFPIKSGDSIGIIHQMLLECKT